MYWDKVKQGLWDFAHGFLMFAVIMIVGVIVVRLLLIPVKKVLVKSKLEHTAKTFLYSLLRFVLYGVIVITAMGTAGVNITSLITALGAAALTAGLAFQDTLKNFVSGIIILINKPITAGDLVRINGYEGYVDSIRMFYTQIHTFDNLTVHIPNSLLTSGSIVNCSVAGTRRICIKCSVSYDDNLTKVKSVIYNVLSKNPKILDDPESKVYVSDHLDSGIEITVFIWVKQEDYYPVLFQTEEEIKNAFDENGITIPYPHVQLAEKTDKKDEFKV